MPSVSAIIIAKDEADRIGECIESVSWCDEIIVLDSGSTDDTVEIARRHGAQVTQTDWPGFGPQKNRALDRATSEWAFEIDCDERAREGLGDEIRTVLASTGHAGFEVQRRNFFKGRPMRHGLWAPEYKLRLFRRDGAKFTDVAVHERIQIDGSIGRLEHGLDHFTVRDQAHFEAKIDYFNALGATIADDQGRHATMTSAYCHAGWTFVRGYLLKRGFLDGRPGWDLACGLTRSVRDRYLAIARRDRQG